MSDTSETTAIDEKKETTNPTPTDPVTETTTFFSNLVQQLIILIVLIIAGGLMLWSARVSQTNLMPTIIEAEPFTSAPLTLATSPVNFNVIKTTDDNGQPIVKSTKIEFPFEENMRIIKYGFFGLDSIRDWTDGPKSTPFWRYLGTIYEKMIINFISNASSFYNILNTNCSESFIVFVMPYLLFFIWPFLLLGFGSINLLYGLFLMFTEIPKLFGVKEGCYEEPVSNVQGPVFEKDYYNKDTKEWIYKLDENKQPIPVTKTRVLWNDPEDATSKNRLTYFWYIFLAICSIFMQIGPFTMFCFSTRSLFTALFLPFCLKAFIVDTGSTDKKEKQPSEYTKGTAIIDILKYKLNIVMYIISYFVVKDAGLSLGTMGAVIAIIACILVYVFYPNIYKSSNGDGPGISAGLADFSQESKIYGPSIINNLSQCKDNASSAISSVANGIPYSFTPKPAIPVAETIIPPSTSPLPVVQGEIVPEKMESEVKGTEVPVATQIAGGRKSRKRIIR